ncbi:MAG: TrkA C-terminal domain-containing protein, partial [Bacteroidota bacterium]|nr:TrkA C-terminal domain-containing protein [Bacteroidota bacterium]
IAMGFVYGKIIELNFKIDKNEFIDIIIILLIGWSMFALELLVTNFSGKYMQTPIHLEALLIGIIASFYVTNFSKYRLYIQKLVEEYGKYVYVVFFTFIGANLALDVIIKYWAVAVLLFGIRLLAVIIASIVGSIAIKETKKKTLVSWTPYITQAGVSLGLITIVSTHFLGFGSQFATILIAVIVLNQFVGPPLMKWAIVSIGEAHVKSKNYKYDHVNDVYIFGVGGKAILLAKTMRKQNYNVKIITDKKNIDISECKSVPILHIDKINYKTLQNHNFKNADTVIIFRKEKEAYKICELIYEKFGTPNILVVMNTHTYAKKFKELGVIVISQTSALITLLTDFVRSPHATQILLGMQEEQKTQDITILAKDIHGHALRDIKLPIGLLLLSIHRNNQILLPHGHTRLRLNDVVTVVGSHKQIDIIRTKFQVN